MLINFNPLVDLEPYAGSQGRLLPSNNLYKQEEYPLANRVTALEFGREDGEPLGLFRPGTPPFLNLQLRSGVTDPFEPFQVDLGSIRSDACPDSLPFSADGSSSSQIAGSCDAIARRALSTEDASDSTGSSVEQSSSKEKSSSLIDNYGASSSASRSPVEDSGYDIALGSDSSEDESLISLTKRSKEASSTSDAYSGNLLPLSADGSSSSQIAGSCDAVARRVISKEAASNSTSSAQPSSEDESLISLTKRSKKASSSSSRAIRRKKVRNPTIPPDLRAKGSSLSSLSGRTSGRKRKGGPIRPDLRTKRAATMDQNGKIKIAKRAAGVIRSTTSNDDKQKIDMTEKRRSEARQRNAVNKAMKCIAKLLEK